jgi:hypothetical protein
MAEVKRLHDDAKLMLYTYTKKALLRWLDAKENLILFDNFIILLKDNMVETYGNIQQFTEENSLKKSIEYFKN